MNINIAGGQSEYSRAFAQKKSLPAGLKIPYIRTRTASSGSNIWTVIWGSFRGPHTARRKEHERIKPCGSSRTSSSRTRMRIGQRALHLAGGFVYLPESGACVSPNALAFPSSSPDVKETDFSCLVWHKCRNLAGCRSCRTGNLRYLQQMPFY